MKADCVVIKSVCVLLTRVYSHDVDKHLHDRIMDISNMEIITYTLRVKVLQEVFIVGLIAINFYIIYVLQTLHATIAKTRKLFYSRIVQLIFL